MKRLLVLLVPCFVMAAGCDREDNDGHDDHFVPPGHRR